MKRLIPLLAATGLALAQTNAAQAASNYIGGTVTVSISSLLFDAVPTGDDVYCELTIISTDAAGTNSETVTGVATVNGGGTAANCTLSIHWWWNVESLSTDILQITYATGIGPSGLTSTSGFTRSSSHSLLSQPLTQSVTLSVADKL